jgi:hypothetical protein
MGEQEIAGETVRACWRYDAVELALKNGCSWGEWRCQDLKPELYTDDGYRADAVGLFKWAHKNGCPCTCEAAAINE